MPACLIALWEGCWNRRNAGTSGRRLAWRPSSSFCRPRLDPAVRTAQVPSADRTLHGYQELFQFLPRQPERGAHRSTGYRTETSAGRLVSLAGSCMRKGQAGCLGAWRIPHMPFTLIKCYGSEAKGRPLLTALCFRNRGYMLHIE